MIRSFRHKGLKRFFERGDRAGLSAELLDRIAEMLATLDESRIVQGMNRASYRLHPLKGRLRGHWSVTVRANWRITFRFEDGDAHDVDLVDYH